MFSNIFDDSKRNCTSMDKAHAMVIASVVLAAKPGYILELGVGTGTGTGAILDAIEYNTTGELTCVDTWLDYGGNEPEFFQAYRDRGVKFFKEHEREFCKDTVSNYYDFLVSDADHGAGWVEEHFRIITPGGIMFFHDTNTPELENLYKIKDIVKDLGWSHYHFTRNSRDDERCHRGLLMVVNGK